MLLERLPTRNAATQHNRVVKDPLRIERGVEMLSDTYRSAADLRALASWYREYAELASNPSIWSSRLSTAEELERQALAAEASGLPLPRG